MDHELIYAKTASGERAMLERTRTMPRNVRMVLILVDSRSSVGDLCLKTGNPQMTESALRELESGGFVEALRHGDSLWPDEERLAHDIRTAAGNNKVKAMPAEPQSGAVVSEAVPVEAAARQSVAPAAVDVQSVGLQAASSLAPAIESPSIGQRFRELFSKPPATSMPPRVEPGDAATPPPATVPSVPTEPSVAPPRLARAPRPRRALSAPAIVALALLMACATLALTVVLFPYARYIPELETALARASGRPVRIATLGVELYPKPVLRLGDVRLGEGATLLRMAELRLEPTPGSLLARRLAVDAAVARGVSLPAEALVGLPVLFSELARAGARTTIKRLEVENARISLAGADLPAMSGAVEFAADGEFAALRMASADKALTVALSPHRQGAQFAGLRVVAEAIGWRPALESAWLVDTANLEGVYADGTLSLSRCEIRVFDGAIIGTAVLAANDERRVRVSGELAFKRLNAARLSEALGYAQSLAGDMDGSLRFALAGETWTSLDASLEADGEFSIDRGRVRGIDLSEAARRMARTPVLGGETKFEKLSGKIRLTPAASRVSEIVLNSGLMQSTGSIEVGKDLALSGRLELRMQGTANQTRVPLFVAGTLRAPSVQAGRGE